MPIICNNCGTELADGVRFCRSCGSPVAAAPAVSAPPPQPAAQKNVFAPAEFDDELQQPAPEPQTPAPEPVQVQPQVRVQQPAPAPAPAPTAAPAPAEAPAPAPTPAPSAPANAPKGGGALGILLAIVLIALIIGVIVFDILYLKGAIEFGKKSVMLGDAAAALTKCR